MLMKSDPETRRHKNPATRTPKTRQREHPECLAVDLGQRVCGGKYFPIPRNQLQ